MKKAAIIAADFYQDITAALLESCRQTLTAAGAGCQVYTVPGALEIAPAIARLVTKQPLQYDYYVALGCVIRGDTYHFEVVSRTSAAAIMQVQLRHNLALGNGILTVDSAAQAWLRTDKGGAAAAAALALAKI